MSKSRYWETVIYANLQKSLKIWREYGFGEKYPKMIKIDVDGIEHLILAGALETLKNPILLGIEILMFWLEKKPVVKLF